MESFIDVRLMARGPKKETYLGMTAVILLAEAVLHALIMMSSSMRPSLISPGAVLWSIKTGSIIIEENVQTGA